MILLHFKQKLDVHILNLSVHAVVGDDIVPKENDLETLRELIFVWLTRGVKNVRMASYYTEQFVERIDLGLQKDPRKSLVKIDLDCFIFDGEVAIRELSFCDSQAIIAVTK